MAEGDVFRFLDTPPGNAIDMQINQHLAIKIGEFRKVLKLAGKQINDKVQDIQELLKKPEKL
jgi:hypothetical protein